MRPRGVAGLVVAGLLVGVGLVVFKAQQAHEDRTVDRVSTSTSMVSCDDSSLRTAVDEAGHYATTPYRLDEERCVGDYAIATVILTTVTADDDTALFHHQDDRWQLLDAGTDLGTAAEHDMPADVWDQLFR